MATQIDTSTNSQATATPSGALVVVAPSDASLNALYFGNNGPELATAQSPYSSWTAQAVGSATTHNSQGLTGHSGDDNLDLLVTSPASGPYYFTGTRSGNAWSLSAIGATGDANNASNTGTSASMWVGGDSQGRIWYIGVDDVLSTYVLAAGYRSGGVWTIDATIDGLALGEQNHQGSAAALVGNDLVLVYDSGAGGLKYRRLDVHTASLGAWSAAAAVGSVADATAASTLSFRAIPGTSTAMLVYSGGNGLSALVYDSVADAWSAAHSLSASTSDRHPALVPGASGVVYALWCQFAAANSYALVGAAYNGTWGTPTTLEASGSNIAWPNGTYLATGTKLALLWTQGTASPYSVEFDAVAAPATGGGGTTVDGSATIIGSAANTIAAVRGHPQSVAAGAAAYAALAPGAALLASATAYASISPGGTLRPIPTATSTLRATSPYATSEVLNG